MIVVFINLQYASTNLAHTSCRSEKKQKSALVGEKRHIIVHYSLKIHGQMHHRG